MQKLSTTQSPASVVPTATGPKTATIGFILSVVSAMFILLEGIVRIFRGEAVEFLGSDALRQRVFSGLRLEAVGAIAVILAIVILLGAYLIYHPGTTTVGGIIVLIFAAISIIAGGGWLIGFILGIIGGILALFKK